MDFGEALKRLREELGMTQQEVADAVGIKRTTYASYENSISKPRYDIMEKLADFYGIPSKKVSDEPKFKTIVEFNSPTVEYTLPNKEKEEELNGDERLVLKYLRALDEKERDEFVKNIRDEYIDMVVGNNKDNN